MATKTTVQCGHCRARYRIDRRRLGDRARCPRCRHPFYLRPKRSFDDAVRDWLLPEDAPPTTSRRSSVTKDSEL